MARACDILSNKWRIFHRAIHLNPEFAIMIKQVCVLLHNFFRGCDSYNFEDTTVIRKLRDGFQEGDMICKESLVFVTTNLITSKQKLDRWAGNCLKYTTAGVVPTSHNVWKSTHKRIYIFEFYKRCRAGKSETCEKALTTFSYFFICLFSMILC